jgi:hypothetical protein
VEGAKRRGPATNPSSPRPPPETTLLLLARRVALVRMGGILSTVNGSKVPYSAAVVLALRQETCRCVNHFRHSWSEQSAQTIHGSRRLGRGNRSKLAACGLGERPDLERNQFGAVGEGDRRRCHAHFTVPVAEHDGGRFRMPRGAEVLVASSHVREEHTIRGRVGHVLSMPPAGVGRHCDPGCADRGSPVTMEAERTSSASPQAPFSSISSVRSCSQLEFSHPSSSPSRFATATAFSTHSIRRSSIGSALPTM